jgi:hypothetical protein
MLLKWSNPNFMKFTKCDIQPNDWTQIISFFIATPLLEECEDDIHTPEMGAWESSRTPKTSELDCRGQNTLHWGVLYIIGKL